MHQRPQHYIQQENAIDIKQGHQAQIKEGKEGGDKEDGDHGGAVAHAQSQELVVNVGLVGHKGVAMTPHAPDHHTDDVETGYHEQREHDDQRIEPEGIVRTGMHAEAYGQQTEEQTDGLTAAIAHKDFTPDFSPPEHVVDEEGHQRAERGKRQHGIGPLTAESVETAQEKQGNHGQAGGQTVDAVDKVDGIDDEHQQHHRKGLAHPWRKLVHAKKAVKVVEPNAGKDNQDGTNQLGEELGLVAHANKIVGDALHVEDDQRRKAERQVGAVGHVRHTSLGRHEQRKQPHHQGQRDSNDGRKGHATQTRHNTLMDLALIGKVKQLLLVGNQNDFRYHKGRQHGTDYKSE